MNIYYDPLVVTCSIVVAICGSGLTFWLAFKNKLNQYRNPLGKLVVSAILTMTIVSMHFIGMAATKFIEIDATQRLLQAQSSHDMLLFTVLFITALIFVATLVLRLLEQRLEDRNKQLSKANKELANQAVQDNLTKLPNRLYLAEYAHLLFTEHRSNQEKIAFLYIDLDRFKAVNDVFGHHVGDQLLIQLANRMHRLLDQDSKLLRIGGDEFLMVLEHTETEHASQVAQRILEIIQESF